MSPRHSLAPLILVVASVLFRAYGLNGFTASSAILDNGGEIAFQKDNEWLLKTTTEESKLILVGRDSKSVYVNDGKENKYKLDFDKKKVYKNDVETYTIIRGKSGIINGRNLGSVKYDDKTSSGQISEKTRDRWVWKEDDGNTYELDVMYRDEWTLYMRCINGDRNVYIGLHGKLLHMSEGRPGTPMKPIAWLTEADYSRVAYLD